MKYRNGFVSNSSSSSFIAVTYTAPKGFLEILEANGIPEDYDWGDLDKLPPEGYDRYSLKGRITFFDCGGLPYSFIGMDIEKLLNEGKTLQECKQELVWRIKKEYNITIPVDKIELKYGEWGNG